MGNLKNLQHFVNQPCMDYFESFDNDLILEKLALLALFEYKKS